MESNLPGRTAWETEQYRKDHGQRAASALGLRLIADFIKNSTGPYPAPGCRIMAPVMDGTEAERFAVVDAWAAENHVTPEWSDSRSHYAAKLSFGPWVYAVYMMPDPVSVPAPAAEARPEMAVA